MTDVVIRDATPGDLDGVVDVFLACWRRSYRGVIADAAIDRWDASSAAEFWRRSLEPTAPELTAVAMSGGKVTGVVRFGPEPAAPERGYVYSLYVHPDAAGGGIGQRLLRHAEAQLAAAGFADARLWVLAANRAAIGFYERCGWRPDGRTQVQPAYGEAEIGLERSLAPGRDMIAEMAEQPARLQAMLARRPAILDALRAAMPRAPHGVTLLARGSSDNAAIYGRYVLELALGRPISLAAPSLWTRYGLSQDLRGHVAIGVSQSGRTPEIATTLAALRDAGAATIAVTNDVASPLAAQADVTLGLDAGVERAVPATKTFTAQVAAFAIIAEALGRPAWSEADWDAIPAAQAQVLADPQPAADAAAVVARSSGSFHLGRGLLYGIALEGALKLAETSSLPATGFSSADFLHGPVAMAGPGTSVVAYTAAGPVAEDVREAAAAAHRAGAPLIVIGDEHRGDGLQVPVPAGLPESLVGLVHVVRAQQIAAHTTLAIGGDPDHPRGLSKVTLTA
jgi:glucosamine--fructose-6-phosphate aminotransferase (isomerizing)